MCCFSQPFQIHALLYVYKVKIYALLFDDCIIYGCLRDEAERSVASDQLSGVQRRKELNTQLRLGRIEKEIFAYIHSFNDGIPGRTVGATFKQTRVGLCHRARWRGHMDVVQIALGGGYICTLRRAMLKSIALVSQRRFRVNVAECPCYWSLVGSG